MRQREGMKSKNFFQIYFLSVNSKYNAVGYKKCFILKGENNE